MNFLFRYRLCSWVWGVLFASSQDCKGGSILLNGYCLFNFLFVLLLGHRLDTRWLFITCVYFFSIQYCLRSWVWGILFCKFKKVHGTNLFLNRFCVLNFLLIGRFGHGFHSRGLFKTLMNFFLFRYRLCSRVWGVLFPSSQDCTGVSILLNAYCLFNLLFVLHLGHRFHTSWLFITCMYFFPIQ